MVCHVLLGTTIIIGCCCARAAKESRAITARMSRSQAAVHLPESQVQRRRQIAHSGGCTSLTVVTGILTPRSISRSPLRLGSERHPEDEVRALAGVHAKFQNSLTARLRFSSCTLMAGTSNSNAVSRVGEEPEARADEGSRESLGLVSRKEWAETLRNRARSQRYTAVTQARMTAQKRCGCGSWRDSVCARCLKACK